MELKDFDITQKNGKMTDIEHKEFSSYFWDIDRRTFPYETTTREGINSSILKYVNGGLESLDIWSDNHPEESSTVYYFMQNEYGISMTNGLEELISWLHSGKTIYICHIEDNVI